MWLAGIDLYVCRCICDFVTGNNRWRKTTEWLWLFLTSWWRCKKPKHNLWKLDRIFDFISLSFDIVIASVSVFTSLFQFLHSYFESKANGLINLSYQNRFSYTLSYKLLCIFYAICVSQSKAAQRKYIYIEKELNKLFFFFIFLELSQLFICHPYLLRKCRFFCQFLCLCVCLSYLQQILKV